jgi:hypothetical protein
MFSITVSLGKRQVTTIIVIPKPKPDAHYVLCETKDGLVGKIRKPDHVVAKG